MYLVKIQDFALRRVNATYVVSKTANSKGRSCRDTSEVLRQLRRVTRRLRSDPEGSWPGRAWPLHVWGPEAMIRFSSTINKHRHIHPKCENHTSPNFAHTQFCAFHDPPRISNDSKIAGWSRIPHQDPIVLSVWTACTLDVGARYKYVYSKARPNEV